ncbi:hypothetical protein [Marmoricola sp. RAF53]|uniref:hypothetical protein n=1 Tax=Marmoricola sp. RAF53 TaxID=3233059 RepID=UPI003F9C0901
MSTWGTGVFACDRGADVLDTYRDLLEDQVPDAEATARMLEEWCNGEDDEVYEAWLALAAAQYKFGRLDDSVRDRALAFIDSGEALGWWAEAGGSALRSRKNALAKLRDQLTGPPRPRKSMRKPRKRPTDLEAGMVLSYSHTVTGLPRLALWRVLHVMDSRTEDVPVLGWLAWDGEETPSPSELERLAVRSHNTLALPPSPDEDLPDEFLRHPATYTVHWAKGQDWQSAGFVLVGTVTSRADDSEASGWTGLGWNVLADEARTHLSRRPAK